MGPGSEDKATGRLDLVLAHGRNDVPTLFYVGTTIPPQLFDAARVCVRTTISATRVLLNDSPPSNLNVLSLSLSLSRQAACATAGAGADEGALVPQGLFEALSLVAVTAVSYLDRAR
eukprot:6192223-Pleurochrysis_carterae.AAC.4